MWGSTAGSVLNSVAGNLAALVSHDYPQACWWMLGAIFNFMIAAYLESRHLKPHRTQS